MNEFNLELAKSGHPIQYMDYDHVSPFQLENNPVEYEKYWVDCNFVSAKQYVNLMVNARIGDKEVHHSSDNFRIKNAKRNI